MSNRAKEHKEEWQRTKELWIWRLEVASNANYSTEFKSEMITFSQLLSSAPESETINTLWSLLEGFLPYLDDSESWDRIWHNLQEFLAREVAKHPKEVITFYSLMHDKLRKPKLYYQKEARAILETGASNEISKKVTLMLIDKIHRNGNTDFQDIQDKLLSEMS